MLLHCFLCWGNRLPCPLTPSHPFLKVFTSQLLDALPTPRRRALVSLDPAVRQPQPPQPLGLWPGEVRLRLRTLMPPSHVGSPTTVGFKERGKMSYRENGEPLFFAVVPLRAWCRWGLLPPSLWPQRNMVRLSSILPCNLYQSASGDAEAWVARSLQFLCKYAASALGFSFKKTESRKAIC